MAAGRKQECHLEPDLKALFRKQLRISNGLDTDCYVVHIVKMKSAFDQDTLPDPMGWLDTFGPKLRADLLRQCSEFALKQGQTIYRTEDPPGGIFTVLQGRIDLHWAHLSSESSLFYVTGPGWWVGDLAAMSGNPRRFDLVAGRESKVLRLNRATLLELVEQSSDIWPGIVRMLTATMSGAVDVMQFLSIDDPTSRTARCLYALNVTGRGWNGTLPLSQAEIASIARISRRRTNGALAELEAAGTIKRGYGEISILDANRLRDWNAPSNVVHQSG
ncbi:MAG: Crp/Fnr family transcriptional regulator [Anderseniella sp.]|nr:Crp/Fnr family transcriptional regulator [Anderseniella sp.]